MRRIIEVCVAGLFLLNCAILLVAAVNASPPPYNPPSGYTIVKTVTLIIPNDTAQSQDLDVMQSFTSEFMANENSDTAIGICVHSGQGLFVCQIGYPSKADTKQASK